MFTQELSLINNVCGSMVSNYFLRSGLPLFSVILHSNVGYHGVVPLFEMTNEIKEFNRLIADAGKSLSSPGSRFVAGHTPLISRSTHWLQHLGSLLRISMAEVVALHCNYVSRCRRKRLHNPNGASLAAKLWFECGIIVFITSYITLIPEVPPASMWFGQSVVKWWLISKRWLLNQG